MFLDRVEFWMDIKVTLLIKGEKKEKKNVNWPLHISDFRFLLETHEREMTYAKHDVCLITITNHVRNFHAELTSADINNNCYNKPS